MTQDDITRRLLLTSDICQQLQLYAQEITRENVSRAYLEAFATRALKRCAQLYVLSRPEAFTNEGLVRDGTRNEALAATALPTSPSARSQRSNGAGSQPADATASTPTPGHSSGNVTPLRAAVTHDHCSTGDDPHAA